MFPSVWRCVQLKGVTFSFWRSFESNPSSGSDIRDQSRTHSYLSVGFALEIVWLKMQASMLSMFFYAGLFLVSFRQHANPINPIQSRTEEFRFSCRCDIFPRFHLALEKKKEMKNVSFENTSEPGADFRTSLYGSDLWPHGHITIGDSRLVTRRTCLFDVSSIPHFLSFSTRLSPSIQTHWTTFLQSCSVCEVET